MLILAYGLGRIMMIVFNQIRDVLFINVGQHAVRSLSNRAFSHTHKLSLRYHLERQTGGHARAIERGVRCGGADCAHGVVELDSDICGIRADCGCFVLLYWLGICSRGGADHHYLYLVHHQGQRVARRHYPQLTEADNEAGRAPLTAC